MFGDASCNALVDVFYVSLGYTVHIHVEKKAFIPKYIIAFPPVSAD